MLAIKLRIILSVIDMLMPSDILDRLKSLVRMLMDADMSGEDKRLGVISMLKTTGGDIEKKLPEVSTWLINLAIEALVGWYKSKQVNV